MQSLARRVVRTGREFLVVTTADLETWAQSRNLSLRQAVAAALTEGVFPECYERNFPALAAAEQLRLFQSCVLVAGLGGLGGNLAVLLTRLGVGHLLLADGDVFTPGNLNRQWLATQATMGRNKAEVAARHLQDINPAVLAEAIPRLLDRDLLKLLLPRVQAVVDGLDSFEGRRVLGTAAWEAAVPMVHGAVVGAFGQVSTLMPAAEGGLEQFLNVLGTEPLVGREVLAPTVALVASLQVQEALRLLLGRPPAYQGLLAHFDGETGRLELVPLA